VLKDIILSSLLQLQLRHEYLAIAFVLILAFILNIVGITWGLPHYLDWAIDSVAPFRVLKAAYYRFSNGWYEIYPPLHFVILVAFNTPFMLYLILSGGIKAPSQFFPFGFVDPLSALTQVILISRVVSVIMGVGIVFLVFLVVRELFDRRSALFSALIVTLYYHLIYYAHNANMDVPYLFWTLLAIYSFLRILKRGGWRDYVLFAIFTVLAIATKDQAAGLFFFTPLPILWARFTESDNPSPRPLNVVKVILDRRHILALIVAVVTFILAQNLIFNFSGFIEHIKYAISSGVQDQSVYRYPSTLVGHFQLLWETMVQLAAGLTPALFGLCLAGCGYCAFKFPKYTLPLLLFAVSYYVTFIISLRLVAPRYALPIGIIMTFFGGKVLAELWHHAPWKSLTRAAICLAFAYAAIFPLQLDFLFIKESRYAAEQWMQEHFEDEAIVETFDGTNAHNYNPRFPAWVKVRTSKLEAGTRWEPQPRRADRVRLPNLYTGREAPDYIVLSSFWYERFLDARAPDSGQRRVLKELCQGTLGYTLVATFKTPTLVAMGDLQINPRIVIFERAKKRSVNAASWRDLEASDSADGCY